jgi:hypothetical protein
MHVPKETLQLLRRVCGGAGRPEERPAIRSHRRSRGQHSAELQAEMCRRSAVAEVAESRVLSCRPDLMALKILVLGVKRFISFQPLLQL